MANKRIKDLSTTAAVTASDDFIAVDGATNGTRKLDAYSPTFGGNLTVSGTGTFSGAITLPNGTAAAPSTRWAGGASTGLYNYDDGFVSGIGFSLGGTYKMRLASTGLEVVNNLTVSGTGNGITIAPTAGAANLVINGAAAGSTINFAQSGTNKYTLEYVSASNFWSIGRSGVAYDLVLKSGNLLLGTTTDSGNGKLQLAAGASDKTSGIGFSSDTSLYRTSAGCLRIDNVSGSNALLALADSGVTKAQFQVFSGDLYIDSNTAGKSIVLRSGNATTALTLDSTQQAKFSSAVYCNTTSQSSGVIGAKLITKQTSGTADWTVTLDGNPDGVAGASYGLRILAGTNSSDYSLYIRNQTNTTTLLAVKGSGGVNMGALPTSSTGLSAGDIWNDAGTLKIV